MTGLTERRNRAWELGIFPAHLSVHNHGKVPAALALGYVKPAPPNGRASASAGARLLRAGC